MAPFGLLVTCASFAAFRGLHWGLQLLPTPGSAAQDRWKWRNICVSLVHSLLTGAGALLGLSLYPQMAADPIHGHPPWALVLVAVSVGYFLADGADMLWNQTLGQAWELLCHHFVAPSLAFSVTSWATLATLALFRLVPLGWMSLWLIRQHHQVPLALVILGGTGLVTVGAMSITLGVRILVSDVLRSRPRPSIPGQKETRGTRRTCCDGELVTRDGSTRSLKD
ncbi:TLC domain-containing protein 2 isoform X2 [Phacochoerus africanus]|uniref:TLC domain-containing protein 2 isoform X2 n=1 Tax=Phacochoerus africanus TaxID=41426 RepID=UPI001FD98752|nr:TLC domain-containing protein 2 isoform X2 [Phacochoerus africanus]